jgi:small GTP-binding protein
MRTTKSAPEREPSLLDIAVVGHTNTGKTSLIRTMLRSTEFGKIEDAAGTTRHVERATIFANSEAILNLHDTPGIEDAYALREKLHVMTTRNKRLSQYELLEKFVADITLNDPLEQEAKVIRQVLRSDVLLYVIDVREPVLEKYLVEIEILSKAMKPIIPVFNFIAAHRTELELWRRKLAVFNIHTSLELDTVAFTFEAEKRLYQKIQSLVESYYSKLQRLIDYRAKVWHQLCISGAKRIAELIISIACYRENKGGYSDMANTTPVTLKLQDFIRQAEQHCLIDLLAMFNFSEKDVALQKIPVQDGQWQLDLFAPGVLKAYGLDVGSSALKGAAAGAGIDLMVGGLSLGAASVIGALAGTGWSTFRRYGKEIQAKIQGTHWLCADDNTLQLLYLRQQQLLDKLMHRGHAACHIDQVDQPLESGNLPDGWREMISILRQNPTWEKPSNARNHNAQYLLIESKLVSTLLRS